MYYKGINYLIKSLLEIHLTSLMVFFEISCCLEISLLRFIIYHCRCFVISDSTKTFKSIYYSIIKFSYVLIITCSPTKYVAFLSWNSCYLVQWLVCAILSSIVCLVSTDSTIASGDSTVTSSDLKVSN